jgi:hypothetical protein
MSVAGERDDGSQLQTKADDLDKPTTPGAVKLSAFVSSRLVSFLQCPASAAGCILFGGRRMTKGSGERHRIVMLRMKNAFL